MKAFPHTKLEQGADGRTWDTSEVRYEGMDLRDYFAAKALVGFIQASSRGVTNFAEVSSLSYKIADAMMKARESK